METQSSRRPIDKQRELGMKKPRLVEAAERAVTPGSAASGSNAFLARFRPNEREREGGRGRVAVDEGKEREEPGPMAYHQQRELLSQYKTALGELTFNSKPIITNLTIIAGENTHAAKGITATICANILEVPSEQKLPSLYLLDSIVKNIGGDYVKYFAARLPEVFCKAYKQVDPSTHPSMQHLFRTWKGVFPSPSLRVIEQELNFPSTVNSSSSGAPTSKSDPQSQQRPAHSIHVNPKYLEARQHLQQSNKSKGAETENIRNTLKEVVAGPAQISVSRGPKPWTEVSVKMANVQTSQGGEPLLEPVYDKRPGSGYVDYETASDPPNRQELENKRSDGRATEGNQGTDQAWYGGIGGSKTNTLIGKRNGYDVARLSSRGLVDSYGTYRASRSGETLPQLTSAPNIASVGTRNTLRNWKNSDEEEFVWDDMNSRTTDFAESDRLKKGGRNHDYSAKPLSAQTQRWMPADSEQLASKWSQAGALSQPGQPVRGDAKFPAQRELDDQESHGWKEAGSRDNREASTDSSSAGQEVETASGYQAGRAQRNQLNQTRLLSRLHPADALHRPSSDSISTGQIEGFSVSGNVSSNVIPQSMGKAGVGLQVGPVATSRFGSLQLPAQGFSGTPGHQPQNWKPPSPTHASHQQPHAHSPSSSAVHQLPFRVRPHNFPDQEHPEVMAFPPGSMASHAAGQANAPLEVQDNQKLLCIPQSQASTLSHSRVPVHLQPLHQSDSISSSLAQRRMHLPFLEPESSQPPGLSRQAQIQPQSFGFQNIAPLSSPKNSSTGFPGQTSTDSLLATILKSGFLPLHSSASNDVPKSASSFSNMSQLESGHSQSSLLPPLPTGPPPLQMSASSDAMASSSTSLLGPSRESVLSGLPRPHLGTSQPPLPPGPPPPSSMVGTSSQSSSSGHAVTNPLSSLLSSLVAKGLISTSAPEASRLTPVPTPIQNQNQSDCVVTSNSILGSSNLVSSSPLNPPDGDLSISESSSLPSGRSNASAEIKDHIGVEFKPEVIREFHFSVIKGLFDDLPYQCSMCGLRLKVEESLSKHLDWHASRKLEFDNCKTISRKWYASLRDWVEGSSGPTHNSATDPSLPAEQSEPMVPADESQCICALCGEPFEDFYCHKKDEWMFKGAAYMRIPTHGVGNADAESSSKLIVHTNCLSESNDGCLEDPQSSLLLKDICNSGISSRALIRQIFGYLWEGERSAIHAFHHAHSQDKDFRLIHGRGKDPRLLLSRINVLCWSDF